MEGKDLYAGKDEGGFLKFLWNSETKQFLGRTGTSWAKIGIFYVIFYLFLAGFFAVMLTVFYKTLDTQVLPKYTPGTKSSILRHPALGFRPLPRSENVESTLIWYNNGDNDDILHWANQLDEFVKPYEGTTEISGQHLTVCKDDSPPNQDQVCKFQDSWLGERCQKEEQWGYARESPCIILKMNRMIGWVPEVYDDPSDLPSQMPQSLKDLITHLNATKKVPKMVWVSCKGENPADEEYIGPVKYTPWQGFPAYYFPFRNTPGYLSPIVAVEFTRPEPNVLINIECRAWAKNIEHDRQNRLGIVHFELLKD